MGSASVIITDTTPYYDQNPGTSGLRKKCADFMKSNYTENFVQSILEYFPIDKRINGTLVIGGDGRYYLDECLSIIIRMAAANKVKRLLVGKSGLISTPASSHLIRKYGCIGGIILTASHNPGGPNADFGIKFNVSSGAPAVEKDTNTVFETSKKLSNYRICSQMDYKLDTLGTQTFLISDGEEKWPFELSIIDGVADYLALMKEIFDFPKIKTFLHEGLNNSQGFKVKIDALNGVGGPYIRRIFCDEFGLSDSSVSNFIPLKDFGGKHPDPNLTYAKHLVEELQTNDIDFGAALDGDADRNMILGKGGFFVSPSDSVAIIAANAVESIPYFSKIGKLKGVARSMPTSSALNVVAEKMYGSSKNCYEVPTGWKFFGNLMDADLLSICGEESFGTGADHVREKDGVWAILAWLSIISTTKKSVEEITKSHWETYGRHYYMRYDYEGLTEEQGKSVMKYVQDSISSGLIGKEFKPSCCQMSLQVTNADDFEYNDPVDGSVSSHQGFRIYFNNHDRIVLRLSGTGSSGSTLRVYMEHFEPDVKKQDQKLQEALCYLAEISGELGNIFNITKMKSPTVIT